MYGTSTKSSLMMVPCGRCGANNFVPATLQKFQTIPCTECRSGVMASVHMDHFELRSVIGQGGMATVYKVEDDKGKIFALKVLHAHLNRERKILERFKQEFAIGKKMAKSQNLVVEKLIQLITEWN